MSDTLHQRVIDYVAGEPSVLPILGSIGLTVGGIFTLVFFGDVELTEKGVLVTKTLRFSRLAWLATVGGGIATIATAMAYSDKKTVAREDGQSRLILEASESHLIAIDSNAPDAPVRINMDELFCVWFTPVHNRLLQISLTDAASNYVTDELGPIARELKIMSAELKPSTKKRICQETLSFVQEAFPGVETTPPSKYRVALR